MSLDVIFICVTVVVCVFLVSHADVRITFTHKQTQPPVVENNPQITQDVVDELYKQEKQATYDDVVSAINDILGGE